MTRSKPFSDDPSLSEIPFSLRYLQACTNFELKNVKESLSQLFLLLRDLEKAASQSSSSEFGGILGVKRTHSDENLGGEAREQL
jgi:hypothetical protein